MTIDSRRLPAGGRPDRRRATTPRKGPALRPRRRRLLLSLLGLVSVFVAVLVALSSTGHPPEARAPVPRAPTLSPLRTRIVAIADSQLGYRTDPANSYCNKYSEYFVAGATDCPGSLRDEEWCADFAAWVWKRAGATVVYQFIHGDLNSSSASFYEWGVRTHTWHPVGSGYRPQPGDVAVYGLNIADLYAAHVAIVVGVTKGERGPTAVNGDGDQTGFSVVERETNEYRADVAGHGPLLSGYVSPS